MTFNEKFTRVRSMTMSLKDLTRKEETSEEKKSCRGYLAPYIIDPFNRWKVLWDINMGLWYLLAYIIDPLIIAFYFKPLQYKGINNFQKLVSLFILIDMVLVPFTQVPKDDNVVPFVEEIDADDKIESETR